MTASRAALLAELERLVGTRQAQGPIELYPWARVWPAAFLLWARVMPTAGQGWAWEADWSHVEEIVERLREEQANVDG